MSHAVTITRTTTTTTTSSAIIVNTGYARSPAGGLKLFETLIGAVCLGLIAYYCSLKTYFQHSSSGFFGGSEESYFFLVTFACLLTTFLLFVSCLLSLSTSSLIPKTLFELLYHIFAFLLYLSASLALLIVVVRRNDRAYTREAGYEGKVAAASLGLINSLLYLLSIFFTYRGFRYN